MDPPSLEPLAPGSQISMTSRRRRCNLASSSSFPPLHPKLDVSARHRYHRAAIQVYMEVYLAGSETSSVLRLVRRDAHSDQDSEREAVSAASTGSGCLSAFNVRESLSSEETVPVWPLCCHLVATELCSNASESR